MLNEVKRVRHLDVRGWVYLLFSAFVGGGSSSVVASFTASMLAPGQFNIQKPSLLIQLMAYTFIFNGLLSVFIFLKQSPLPPIITNGNGK